MAVTWRGRTCQTRTPGLTGLWGSWSPLVRRGRSFGARGRLCRSLPGRSLLRPLRGVWTHLRPQPPCGHSLCSASQRLFLGPPSQWIQAPLMLSLTLVTISKALSPNGRGGGAQPVSLGTQLSPWRPSPLPPPRPGMVQRAPGFTQTWRPEEQCGCRRVLCSVSNEQFQGTAGWGYPVLWC